MERTDRDLRGDRLLYYAARFFGQTNQNLLLACLFLIAGTGDNTGVGLSGVFMATLLPAILFGLAGGALVDRVGPARGLALGAALRLAPIAVGVLLGGDPRFMWAVAFGFAAGSQVSNPAELALVRTLQRSDAASVHGITVAAQYAGQAVGVIALAPALYFIGGTQLMLVGAFAGAVTAVGLGQALAWRLRDTVAGRSQPTKQALSFATTCRFFAAEERARYAVVVTAFKVIVARGIVVALPIYLSRDIGLGREAVTYLLLPGIAGAVVGLAWTSRTVTLERAQRVMRSALAGMIVAVFALAIFDYGIELATRHSQIGPIVRLEAFMNTTFIVALPAAFLMGLSLSGALISARVALTETAPQGQQARVFAVQSTLTEAVLVLPLMLAGLGTDYAGARVTLGAIGAMAIVGFLVLELPQLLGRTAGPAGGHTPESAASAAQ